MNSEAVCVTGDAMFLSLTIQFGSDSIFSEILYSTSVQSKTIFNTCVTIVECLKKI